MKSFLILAIAAFAACVLVSRAPNHANNRGAADLPAAVSRSGSPANLASGRALFLKNCAHCHGSDAHGDEGPDLRNLDWTDEQITVRIRDGKKGQMTAFAGKFSPQQIRDVVTYLRTLK